jgi:hypothetical protein
MRGGGYARIPRDLWPAIVSAFSPPWLEEWVDADLEYWRGEAERESKGFRSCLPRRGRGLSAPYCAKRWGWSLHHARKALKRSDPLVNLRQHRTDTERTKKRRNKQSKADNAQKSSDSLIQNDIESTETFTRAEGADLIPHTADSIPPKPPLPPKGESLEEAVRGVLDRDLWRLPDHEWWTSEEPEKHPLWDVYAIAREQDARLERSENSEALRVAILADRRRVPPSAPEVLAELLRLGWTGSKRLREIERAVNKCNDKPEQSGTD